MKISALIFSMNRVENVIRLAEKIRNFVDEIVIIDSSKKNNYELLKKKLKFARVYWFPPIGIADLYYQISMNLCKYNWIFHLDDDEDPNTELIYELRNLPKYSAKVFLINRIEKSVESKQVRFFHRDSVKSTGIIHWGYEIKGDVAELGDKYLIHHIDTGEDFLKRFKVFIV